MIAIDIVLYMYTLYEVIDFLCGDAHFKIFLSVVSLFHCNLLGKGCTCIPIYIYIYVTRKAITDLMALAIFDRRSVFNSLLHSHL